MNLLEILETEGLSKIDSNNFVNIFCGVCKEERHHMITYYHWQNHFQPSLGIKCTCCRSTVSICEDVINITNHEIKIKRKMLKNMVEVIIENKTFTIDKNMVNIFLQNRFLL